METPINWKPGHRARTHLLRTGYPWLKGHDMKLSSGPHLLLDWRYVLVGEPGKLGPYWASKDGDQIPLRLYNEAHWEGRSIEARYISQDVPRGIRIVCEKAQKSEPFPFGAPPGQRIIYRDGIYRTWQKEQEGVENAIMRYVESSDGFNWGKVNECTIDWSACPSMKGRERAHEIFLDSQGPEEERFKMFFRGDMPDDEQEVKRIVERFQRDRPDDIVPRGDTLDRLGAMWGAVSPDGIEWRALPEPLVLHHSDTSNVAYYDTRLERYVWYCRCWSYYGRRCIGRAETADFRKWPAPEVIVWPNADSHPSDDWYTNSKTVYPGTVDQHLMFPALYHHADDNSELRLFSSPDGIMWSQVPGGAVVETGPSGTWDAECVFGGTDLIPLSENRVALPYSGYRFPHKYPRNYFNFKPQTAYAIWPKGRLGAIEAAEEGSFTTQPVVFSGRTLVLNLQTKCAGQVVVELADREGKPLPDRSFQEADPISGDFLDKTVTWKGEADLKRQLDQPVMLRFRMRAAKIYSFEFI